MQHLQDSQAILAGFLRKANHGAGDGLEAPNVSLSDLNMADLGNGGAIDAATGKTISFKTKEKLKVHLLILSIFCVISRYTYSIYVDNQQNFLFRK